MGLVPTRDAVMGQFSNGRNSTDDFLQLAANNGGNVFAWIDNGGVLRGSFTAGLANPGGANTTVQVNSSGSFLGDLGFTYDATAKVLGGLGGLYFSGTSLSTPTNLIVTPSPAGATTYQYFVSANYKNMWSPAVGPTTIANGPVTLDGSHFNIVTWTGVPGATSYDVWVSKNGASVTFAGNTVSTTFNDVGALDTAISFPPQVGNTGFLSTNTGIYSGPMLNTLAEAGQGEIFNFMASVMGATDSDVTNYISAGSFYAQANIFGEAIALQAMSYATGNSQSVGMLSSARANPGPGNTSALVTSFQTDSWFFGGTGGTITDLVGFLAASNKNTGAGTVVTRNKGIWVQAQQGIGTNNYGIYIDNQGAAASDFSLFIEGGNVAIGGTAAGKITKYNNIATVANGVPSIYAAVDLTTQNAAIGTTTLYAVPATGAGQYDLTWSAKVTTPAGATSTLGALTITYTDPDSVVQTITAVAQSKTGTMETTDTGNSTTTVLLGMPLQLNCKASTNIQYAMAYASNAANVMQYNLHIRLKAL